MKSFIYAAVAAAALSASYGAFAQSTPSGQLTREQVRAELVQLEQAGYKPEVSDTQYPRALQTAQERVTNADATGYGAQAAPRIHAGRVAAARQDGRDRSTSASNAARVLRYARAVPRTPLPFIGAGCCFVGACTSMQACMPTRAP